MIDKLKVLTLYQSGMTCKEISEEVGATEVAVRKSLERNFPEEIKEIKKLRKEQNKINRKEKKKEARQALQKKARQTKEEEPDFIKAWASNNPHAGCRLSNGALIKCCRHAYTTDEKGNLVYNEKRNGARPMDIPKKYKPVII